MHIVRFSFNDQVQWGILEGDDIRAIEGDLYDNPRGGSRLCALSDARLLAPIDAHANRSWQSRRTTATRQDATGPASS